jgi:murein DD-endopeptidase MepM/ murein hydrolase activator NlpD
VKNNNNKGFYAALYVTAAAFLVIAFGVTMSNTKSIAEKNKQKAKIESTTTAQSAQSDYENYAAVGKSDVKSYTESTTEKITSMQKSETPTQAPSNKSATADANPSYSVFTAEKEMVWPVNGKIVMDYSVETGVFDKTLDMYRTNDSICISAPVGTEVVAAADGVVKSIGVDEINGVTVCVDDGNGWTTTYSQLRNDIPLSEGQVVYAGDTIGLISEPTEFSAELGPHLRFTVCEDDKTFDPKTILEEEDE